MSSGFSTAKAEVPEQAVIDSPVVIGVLQKADRLEILQQAERIQAFDDRRVVHGGARRILDGGLRIHDDHADSGARQLQGRDQADRPGT